MYGTQKAIICKNREDSINTEIYLKDQWQDEIIEFKEMGQFLAFKVAFEAGSSSWNSKEGQELRKLKRKLEDEGGIIIQLFQKLKHNSTLEFPL